MANEPPALPHIRLGAKHYRLCPTIEDLSAIETNLSTSLLALARKLADGLMPLEELMVIIEHSVEADARVLHVRELALREGLTHLTEAVTSLFLQLFQPHTHEGMSRAELEAMAQQFEDK
jgi:hypothetical protein